MKKLNFVKQKFLRVAAGGAIIAGLLPISDAYAVSAFPSSGSCAMLITQPVPVGMTIPAVNGYNVLAVINFTSATGGTIDYSEVIVNYTATGSSVNTAQSKGGSVPFTVGNLPAGLPAAGKSLTFTPVGSPGPVVAYAIPVNNGSTILIQGGSSPFSGVCQF